MSVHLLGDSTLDNLIWVNCDQKKCVKGQLETLLKNREEFDTQVDDLSFDGFTTEDVLAKSNRKEIGIVLARFPNYRPYMDVKAKGRESHLLKPLEELKANIQKAPEKKHYVVVSVGGNDFRKNLANPLKFVGDIAKIQKRHKEILEEVRKIGSNVKPIIMMQYRTDRNDDHYGIYNPVLKIIGIGSLVLQAVGVILVATSLVALTGTVGIVVAPILIALGVLAIYIGSTVLLPKTFIEILRKKEISMLVFGSLLERFYRPILEYAKNNNIAVLDLPNTMNPKNPLYESGIEPNEEGGALIAKGIHHILTNYEENKNMLYSTNLEQNDEYVARENDPKKYRVIYPT